MEKSKRKFSKKTRQRMAEAHKGKKLSDETKAKISAARQEREAMIEQGLLQPFRHSDKTKRKMSRLAKERAAQRKKNARSKSRRVVRK